MSLKDPDSSVFAPTVTRERILSLDLLRGFANFGMFFIHMTSLPWNWVLETQGQSLFDGFLGRVGEMLFSTKALSLFSILFGFGIALQLQRSDSRIGSFLPYYLRRMLGLLLIGSLFMVFFVGNDVLVIYALFGIVLLPLARCRSWIVILAGCVLASVYIIADTLTSVPKYFGKLRFFLFMAGGLDYGVRPHPHRCLR